MASIRKYKKSGEKKGYYEFRIRYKDPITHEYKEKSKRGFTSSIELKLLLQRQGIAKRNSVY